MMKPRIRTVPGSCWPCKKRRVKCDLAKPACRRCLAHDAPCNYGAQLIRWSPVVMPHVAAAERRALDYFHGRLWPLLTTALDPCAPPLHVALEHRVVLLAACVLADSHRLLQDGGASPDALESRRLECLAAVRLEVDVCRASGRGPLLRLLFAVLLLYFHEGYMECTRPTASTASHRAGVLAIIDCLGGIDATLAVATDALQMLLSEFASTDLTTSMLWGTVPAFPPTVWDAIDKASVWWGRDPLGRCSLASVFQQIATMALYLDALAKGQDLCMDRVHEFESALRPVYAPLPLHDINDTVSSLSTHDLEAIHAFTLIRAFQHAALIYLYRAICRLPTSHGLVQQHVQCCLACVSDMEHSSRVLHCIVFPLMVAGAHALQPRHREAVRHEFTLVYDSLRFASVRACSDALENIWAGEGPVPWIDMFAPLSLHALVL